MKRTSILKLDAGQSRTRSRRRRWRWPRPKGSRRIAAPSRSGSIRRTAHDRGRGSRRRPRTARLIEVTLDEGSIGRNNAEVEHEREVAIFDLLEKNSFALEGHDGGPYTLHLSLADNRLVFNVGDSERAPIQQVTLVALALPPDGEGLFPGLRELLRGDQDAARVARSRPSTWAGAASTTKEAISCSSGSEARSRSTSPPRGACSRCSARCTGRADARRDF